MSILQGIGLFALASTCGTVIALRLIAMTPRDDDIGTGV